MENHDDETLEDVLVEDLRSALQGVGQECEYRSRHTALLFISCMLEYNQTHRAKLVSCARLRDWIRDDCVLLALVGPPHKVRALLRGYVRMYCGHDDPPHDSMRLIQRWFPINPDSKTAQHSKYIFDFLSRN